jgi:hypothetical protein
MSLSRKIGDVLSWWSALPIAPGETLSGGRICAWGKKAGICASHQSVIFDVAQQQVFFSVEVMAAHLEELGQSDLARGGPRRTASRRGGRWSWRSCAALGDVVLEAGRKDRR